MALAMQIDQPDLAQVHQRVMRVMKRISPREVDAQLEQDKLLHPLEAFRQQLPFYRVKPLYIACIHALHELGARWPFPVSLVSVLAWAGLGLVALLWRPKAVPLALWAGVAAAGMVFYDVLYLDWLARLNTPDALAACLTAAALLVWVKWQRLWLFLGFMLLAIAARIDSLLLLVMLLPVLTLLPAPYRVSRRAALLGCLAGALLYGWIVHASGYYGWRTQVYYTLVEPLPYPAEFTGGVTLDHYLSLIRYEMTKLFTDRLPMIYAGLTAVTLLAHWRYPAGGRVFAVLLLVLWAHVLLRMLSFPRWEWRFFIADFFLMTLLMAELWALMSARLLSRVRLPAPLR